MVNIFGKNIFNFKGPYISEKSPIWADFVLKRFRMTSRLRFCKKKKSCPKNICENYLQWHPLFVEQLSLIVRQGLKQYKNSVRMSCSSCRPPSIHKCCPPTARCKNCCLLRFRPGPVRSLPSNLVHRNFHFGHHIDTLLRMDTRST